MNTRRVHDSSIQWTLLRSRTAERPSRFHAPTTALSAIQRGQPAGEWIQITAVEIWLCEAPWTRQRGHTNRLSHKAIWSRVGNGARVLPLHELSQPSCKCLFRVASYCVIEVIEVYYTADYIRHEIGSISENGSSDITSSNPIYIYIYIYIGWHWAFVNRSCWLWFEGSATSWTVHSNIMAKTCVKFSPPLFWGTCVAANHSNQASQTFLAKPDWTKL